MVLKKSLKTFCFQGFFLIGLFGKVGKGNFMQAKPSGNGVTVFVICVDHRLFGIEQGGGTGNSLFRLGAHSAGEQLLGRF